MNDIESPFTMEALHQMRNTDSANHPLAPLLYHHLRDRAILPPDVEEAWRQQYFRTAQANHLLLDVLEASLDRLSEAGTDVILLKGAALIQTIYDNIALRPLRDLDLLVRPHAVPAALEALASLGYAPTGIEQRPGITSQFENEILLHGPGQPAIPIELHWSLFDSPYYQEKIPLDWFWQTALPLNVGRQQALILGPEAQLLHLCGHLLLHHQGSEPLWWYDIAGVIRHYQAQIHWDELLSRAREYDLLIPLQQVLPQLAAQWQITLPGDFLVQLSLAGPSTAERKVFASLTAAHRPPAQRLWADLAALPGWRQRLHFAWANLFPSPAYMRRRYAIRRRPLLPFYYPYRWAIGFRNYFTRS